MNEDKKLIEEARNFRILQLPPSPWGDKHIVNRLADRLEELNEALSVIRYLDEHPGYPGFIRHKDLTDILNDYNVPPADPNSH